MEENNKEERLSTMWNLLDRLPPQRSQDTSQVRNSEHKVEDNNSEDSSFSNNIVRNATHNSNQPKFYANRSNIQKRNYSCGPASYKTKVGSLATNKLQNKASDDYQNCSYDKNRKYYQNRSNNENPAREFGNDKFQNTVKAKPFSFTTLCELVTKSPDEILMSINKKNCGFYVLLNKDDMRPDMMALVLIALGKSCSANLEKNAIALIQSVCNTTNFPLKIQKYLVSIRINTLTSFHLESLSYLTIFLQTFQHALPSSSSEIISILLPLLKLSCDKFLSFHELYDDLKKKLDEIQETNEEFVKKYTSSEIKKVSAREKLHLIEPPENYRTIPVLPNFDDINLPNTFLRTNIVKGKYSSTEHYLDVQYRLLREDYVRPLRNGIADYLRLKKSGKSMKNIKDVQVYNNVHIFKRDFVYGSMVHIVSFPKENFSKVKWEYSKRFLTGSLLCLSSDDFQTMLFAVVAQRKPEELNKGLLLIRFEEISDKVLNLKSSESFVVIEISAYFEAYRYNLKALQELNENNFPFQKYIVDTESTVGPPNYLNETVTYDFRPLLVPLEEKYIKHTDDMNGNVIITYDYPSNVSISAKSIPVLNDSCWPSEVDLNLDHSQYTALKAAITKEFAIIQGPPGTGKTYIGLRIVQLLLYNLHKWLIKDIDSLPILVVCFTNHALDQFLEGLMHFTNKIVRIGGRGTNEVVSKFQLHTLKCKAANKKEIPNYLSSSLWHKNQELKSLKDDIDQMNQNLEKCQSVVLGENVLEEHIPSFQYSSLKSLIYQFGFKGQSLKDDGCIIHDWLYIRSRMAEQDNNSQFSECNIQSITSNTENNITNVENDDDDDDDDDDMDSIGEADVEFIEAQRDIDSEDFAGVSFNIEVPENEELLLANNSGWKIQGRKKKLVKYIKNSLKNSIPFDETEAMKITNVWNLNVVQRWKLYKFWLEKYITEEQKECMKQQQLLKTLYQEVSEIRMEVEMFILKKAHVVGITTTGAAKYRNIVLRLNPQILVVEEAAEILESHIVTSLAPHTQHIILIGDHQQLRPNPTVHTLAVNFNLNISLFERMVKNNMEYSRLSTQHRMRPDVADLIVPHIYTGLKNHETVTKYENIKGVSKNVFFINHSYNELQETDSKSTVNEHEAAFLIKLCKYLILQGYDSSKITVLATYSGQMFAMKKLKTDVIENVKFTVVDNFQGEENDIILISFVRSNEEGEIGFLNVSNRVCVALSRARKGLYCVGNFELLAAKNKLWKNIVGTLHQKQAIGSSLQLMCQNHPGVGSMVASEKDFESVPEGGCSRHCEYRLSCGHACTLMCHPYDMAHETIHCYKDCNTFCEQGHKCQKECYKECGPCDHLVDKKMYNCGHILKVHCHMQNQDIECFAKCDKVLSCGHKCSNTCSEACIIDCKEKIEIKSPICGHQLTIECCFQTLPEKLIAKCTNPCREILECGHVCKGNCACCKQGRLHTVCNRPCKRILVCGHECKSPCSKSCPPCKLPCENRCIHSKCPKTCGEPCELCSEPCGWFCKHIKCTQRCGDLCNRIPCNKPCDKLLLCNHPCVGFCGEPCPEECRICNSDIVKEIIFGTEEEKDARFVQLEDCKHILEISGLSQWMEIDTKSNCQIQMKACPKCKTVIRRNLRFGNVVKDCLKKLEKVKNVIYGNIDKNKEIQTNLLKLIEENQLQFKEMYNCLPLYKCWVKILKSSRSKSIQQITIMKNIFNLFLKFLDSACYLVKYKISIYIDQETAIKERITVLSNFLDSSISWILNFIQGNYLLISEQQQQQLNCEIHRIKMGKKLLMFVKERKIKLPNPNFKKCVSHLISYKPFDDNSLKAFCVSFKNLAQSCGSAMINISELEKQSILKAIGLSKGHWYQCPNGHVYCITECGGAVMQGRCNECNAMIGGANHSLLNTNQVATDMDGAKHSAWSDAANMRN